MGAKVLAGCCVEKLRPILKEAEAVKQSATSSSLLTSLQSN